MDRNAYVKALGQLDILLSRQDVNEAVCQAWFEENEWVFQCLGYRRAIPHPRMKTGSEEYIPDFLVERHDGLWEVFEIKTPMTRLLKKAKRREQFYATIHEYISQCLEYCEFFDDRDNRRRFYECYEFCPQKGIGSILVAGRSLNIDRTKLFHISSRFSHKVRPITYDDIRNYIEFDRARLFADSENLPGASIHLIIAPRKLHGSVNFIMDLGTSENRNRLSIFIDEKDRLCLRAIDDNSDVHTTRVPISETDLPYGDVVYFSFELGFAKNYTVCSVEVNGKYFSDRKLDRFPIKLRSDYYVIGSDVDGRQKSAMDALEIYVYGRTIDFHGKEQLKEYVFRSVQDFALGIRRQRIRFENGRFMHSRAHPNFRAPDGTGRPTDMVQADKARQPQFVND